MASRKRVLLAPINDWQRLQCQLDWPEQTRYELIRPGVIFGTPLADSTQQIGVSARKIYRRIRWCDNLGIQRLLEAKPIKDIWKGASVSWSRS